MKESDNNQIEDKKFLTAKEHRLIFKKYKPIEKIGSGSFSSVFLCKNILTNEFFSMKAENMRSKSKFLKSEAFHLVLLKGFGIPECISFGHTKTHYVLIETLLGKTLLSIAQEINNGLKLTDICLCALQILDRIEWVHSKNMIHRDIKPENFLFGIKDPDVLYLIDFGLCKKYRSDKTGKHMMPKLTGKFNGTVRYASVNSLKGKECSRRDDLISIGYMLIYLKNYELPWKDTLHNIERDEYFDMLCAKQSAQTKNLCKNLPKEFNDYMNYVYSLKFEQDPNYEYLKSLFKQILNHLCNNPKNDNYISFSWLNEEKKNKSKSPILKFRRNKSPQYNLLQKIQLNHEKNKTISDTLVNTGVTSKSVDKTSGNTIDIKNSFGINSNDSNKFFPRKFKNCKISKGDEVEFVNDSKLRFSISPENDDYSNQKSYLIYNSKINSINKSINQNLPIKKFNKEVYSYKKIIPSNRNSVKISEKTSHIKKENQKKIINNMQTQKIMTQLNQNKVANYRHSKINSTLNTINQNPNNKLINKTINNTYKSLLSNTEHIEKKKYISKFPQNKKKSLDKKDVNVNVRKKNLISPELKSNKYCYNSLLDNYCSEGNFRLNDPTANFSINNDYSANNIQIFDNNENLSLMNKNQFDYQRSSCEKSRNNYSVQKYDVKSDNNLCINYRRRFKPKSDNLDKEVDKNKKKDNFKYKKIDFGSSIVSTFDNKIAKDNLAVNSGKNYISLKNRYINYNNSPKNQSIS